MRFLGLLLHRKLVRGGDFERIADWSLAQRGYCERRSPSAMLARRDARKAHFHPRRSWIELPKLQVRSRGCGESLVGSAWVQCCTYLFECRKVTVVNLSSGADLRVTARVNWRKIPITLVGPSSRVKSWRHRHRLSLEQP